MVDISTDTLVELIFVEYEYSKLSLAPSLPIPSVGTGAISSSNPPAIARFDSPLLLCCECGSGTNSRFYTFSGC